MTSENMTIGKFEVQRFSVISRNSFQDVLATLHAAVGHPDMDEFRKSVSATKTFSEMQKAIQSAIGPSGFMEFTRFDHGEVVHKAGKAQAPQMVRVVIGNPLIMRQMVVQVSDAGSYAPVTILVDERADGVHLSYDRVASFLTPYGNAEALKVAQELDAKVEALLPQLPVKKKTTNMEPKPKMVRDNAGNVTAPTPFIGTRLEKYAYRQV